MRPLRVGVAGAGWVATARHIPSFKRNPNAEIIALYDRSPERASAAAERFGIPNHADSLDRLFDHELDVLSVCTPPWTHPEITIAALERGVHVFTEKPMALCLADAQHMADAARRAGRQLCVSHNFLFSRAAQRAERLLASAGAVSHAFGVQLSSPDRRLPAWYKELPGGLMLDESPHILYTLQRYLGRLELESVRAVRRTDDDHPSSVDLLLRSETGLGQITMLFDAPVSEWHVVLVAADGIVALDLFRDIAFKVSRDGHHGPADILRTSGAALLGHATGFVSSGARYATGRLMWGHDELITAFLEAIHGRRDTPVPLDDALAVVSLTDGILSEIGAR